MALINFNHDILPMGTITQDSQYYSQCNLLV
jgi:hypothetical protein